MHIFFTPRCLTEIMADCNEIARCQNDVVHAIQQMRSGIVWGVERYDGNI